MDSVYGVVFPYTQLPARKKWGQAVLLKNLGDFLNGASPRLAVPWHQAAPERGKSPAAVNPLAPCVA